MRYIFFITSLFFQFTVTVCAEDRPAEVAGTFYPADPKELSVMAESFLGSAPAPVESKGKLVALIVPHAGYIYSGKTAAHAYRLLQNEHPDTVILMGPYHRAPVKGASVWPSGQWETPLGKVSVDEELARELLAKNPAFSFVPEAHAGEHSLETQLPFLQKSLKDFKILPITLNDASPDNTRSLAGTLVDAARGRNVLFVISTDMSHYFPDEAARKMDAGTLELLQKQDPASLAKALAEEESQLCGHAAVLTWLKIARLLGHTELEILHYSTSADATHDKGRVVGYTAAVVTADAAQSSERLTENQKEKLLSLARRTVEASVLGKALPEPDFSEDLFKAQRAVFVTLQKNGELRGCIGRLAAEEALGQAVRNMAVESALKDPRFPPVSAAELGNLSYEVSVLSLPSRVPDASAVKAGKHGVILRQGTRGGIFLPKVAEVFNGDKDAFLSELCSQKAGLPRDCWKDPRTEISVFTAEEFSEKA